MPGPRVSYLQVTMATVVVLVVLVIGGGVLRGAGDSRTPMIVTGIANVVNVALAYGLIYGHWGLPAMGAVGSAWATFLARSLALVLLFRALWVGRNGVRLRRGGSSRPLWSVARQVLSLGVPAAIEQVLFSMALLVLTILAARLGTDTVAAQRISATALSFSFLPGIGFGVAATALVGQRTGARQPGAAVQVTRAATIWAVAWMSAIGLLLFLFAEPVMRLFTGDPQVISIGADGLRVIAFGQPFWAVGSVQSGAVRGTGDTRFPLIIGATGTWTTVLLAWLGMSFLGGGLSAIWAAFLVVSPVSAFLNWRRFHGRMRELKAESLPDGPHVVDHSVHRPLPVTIPTEQGRQADDQG